MACDHAWECDVVLIEREESGSEVNAEVVLEVRCTTCCARALFKDGETWAPSISMPVRITSGQPAS